MQYHHTQNGILIKRIMGGAIAFFLVMASVVGLDTVTAFVFYGAVALMLLLSWLFSSLTISVDSEELQHYFGPGFWKKTYVLQDIESIEQVRNSWIFGWGIRLTPYGWLYNVSGLDAVEVQLRSGRKFRIGTDDPQGVISAIHGNNA